MGIGLNSGILWEEALHSALMPVTPQASMGSLADSKEGGRVRGGEGRGGREGGGREGGRVAMLLPLLLVCSWDGAATFFPGKAWFDAWISPWLIPWWVDAWEEGVDARLVPCAKAGERAGQGHQRPRHDEAQSGNQNGEWLDS